MTEEIIIGGVNVAGCINFVGCNMCNDFLDGQCEGHNCEYKQLKRLEQERDDLQLRKDKYYQQTLDDAITISDLITKCNDLEQENKELKEEKEAFKTMATVPTRMYNECERERCKYGRALEEIRDIIRADCKRCTAECDCDDDCTRYKIKTKINEVLQ